MKLLTINAAVNSSNSPHYLVLYGDNRARGKCSEELAQLHRHLANLLASFGNRFPGNLDSLPTELAPNFSQFLPCNEG